MKNKGGRPTIFNQDLADKICQDVVRGKSLIKISKEMKFDLSNFFKWLREKPEFSQQYTRAKAEQADTLIEEILDIADCTKFDKTTDENGKVITDHEHSTRSRLRVDTRKWVAGKMRPKKYGEKLILDEDSKKLLAPTIILKQD